MIDKASHIGQLKVLLPEPNEEPPAPVVVVDDGVVVVLEPDEPVSLVALLFIGSLFKILII